jgi:hypothetical protein
MKGVELYGQVRRVVLRRLRLRTHRWLDDARAVRHLRGFDLRSRGTALEAGNRRGHKRSAPNVQFVNLIS